MLYLAVPSHMVDPFWLRMTVGAYFLAVFAASFVLAPVRAHFSSVISGGMFLATGWLTWLLYANGFRDEYISAYFVMAFASALIFESRVLLMAFSAYNIAILGVAALLVENPQFNIESFFSLAISIYLVANLVIGSRLRTKENLEKGLGQSQMVQETAIQTSRDGILIVDTEGNFLSSNLAFTDMWEMPRHLIDENNIPGNNTSN
ncbi:MAG: hypothetical protein AAF570_17115 [Bacteroidota bacterium]